MWFNRPSARLWAIVAIWLLVIFGASSDAGSSRRSSRIIGPIVRWLYPSIDDLQLSQVVGFVRKAAHVTEYGILAVLLWRAIRRSRPAPGWSWEGRAALWAWALATTYAATDEYHQSFVPSRSGQWQDVVLDSSGAALGLLLTWGWFHWRSSRRLPA